MHAAGSLSVVGRSGVAASKRWSFTGRPRSSRRLSVRNFKIDVTLIPLGKWSLLELEVTDAFFDQVRSDVRTNENRLHWAGRPLDMHEHVFRGRAWLRFVDPARAFLVGLRV